MKNKVLNSISSYATSKTKDNLILKNGDTTFKYISSNPDLYVIKESKAYVNKVYQTHQEQRVNVKIEIISKDGEKDFLEKDIIVGPIIYKDLNETPIATYFYTWAMSYYKRHSKHYNKTGNIFPNKIKENLDIIYYSFLRPHEDGTLVLEDKTYLEEVRNLKAHDVRVLFTIDGVSKKTSDVFKIVTSSKKNIDNFVKNILDLVDFYKFDGVDIDWEPFTGGVIPSQLDSFVVALKEEMNKRQHKNGTPYLLTLAVPGGRETLKKGWFNLDNLSSVADYINFMTYDLNDRNFTTHLTPVGFGGAKSLISYLKEINFPLNKVIIGSGAYGKSYQLIEKTRDNPLRKKASLVHLTDYVDLGSFKTGTLYIQAIEVLKKNHKYRQANDYDSTGLLIGSYLYNQEKGIYITYESKKSSQEKIKLINKYLGMGIMTWAYSQDANNYILNALINERKKISK